jgi:hypothetical protein
VVRGEFAQTVERPDAARPDQTEETKVPKLIFRGASIRFVDLRYDDKSKSTYTKLNFTAQFSEPVREAMEWGEPPEGLATGNLDGEMNATHFILTPNGSELKQHEMQLDAKTIGAFQFVRSDDGNKLRFQIVTSVDGAAALAEQYLRVIGAGEAQLRVNYEQQEELDIAPAEEVQESLETSEGGAPLASVTTMGGSHQKKGRK